MAIIGADTDTLNGTLGNAVDYLAEVREWFVGAIADVGPLQSTPDRHTDLDTNVQQVYDNLVELALRLIDALVGVAQGNNEAIDELGRLLEGTEYANTHLADFTGGGRGGG